MLLWLLLSACVAHASREWAVITGASSGIGAALAREAAKSEANVILSGRDIDRLRAVAADLELLYGAETHVLVVDLCAPDGAEALHRQVQEWCDASGARVNMLVANAGGASVGSFVEQPLEQVDAMLLLNLRSTVALCRLFGADFAAQDGPSRIVITASLAGCSPLGVAGGAVYAATKAALRSFSNALHDELRPDAVHVSCLLPGAVDTGFKDPARMGDTLIFGLGRLGSFLGLVQSPEDVARCVDLRPSSRARREYVPGALNKAFAAAPKAFTRRFAALAFAPRDKVLAPFRASLRRVLPQKLPLPR